MKRLLPFVFFAIAINAWPNEASQLSKANTPQQKTAPAKAKADTPKDIRGTQELPLIVKVQPAPDAEEKAENESKENAEKSKLDTWIAESTIALAVITGLLALFTAFLWNATKNLVKDAKSTGEREHRAYVSVKGANFRQVQPGLPLVFEYEIKNVGRSPARNIQLWSKIEILQYPLREAFTIVWPQLPDPSSGTLFPDEKYTTKAYSGCAMTDNEWSGFDLNQMTRPYLFCRLMYIDIFGESRTTEYAACVDGAEIREMYRFQKYNASVTMQYTHAAFGNRFT